MRIIFFLAVALALSPVSGDYPTMIREARNCFETGRFEECDSLLTELRGLKLKRLQRRKVCTLWLDNTYRGGHHEEFLDRFPADSTYVEGTQTTTMADRTWESKVYVIRKAHLAFAGAECEVPDVVIKLEDYGSSRSDGSVGVDALLPFKSLVFNARKLYLQLNK